MDRRPTQASKAATDGNGGVISPLQRSAGSPAAAPAAAPVPSLPPLIPIQNDELSPLQEQQQRLNASPVGSDEQLMVGARVSCAAKCFDGSRGFLWSVETFGPDGGSTRIYGNIADVIPGERGRAPSYHVKWDVQVPEFDALCPFVSCMHACMTVTVNELSLNCSVSMSMSKKHQVYFPAAHNT